MHITLTDHLTCPRCGPSAGLILLMESAVDRRVVEGALGCAVCRTRYRISGRVADLRSAEGGGNGGAHARAPAPAPARGAVGGAGEEGRGMRVAAMLDAGEGRGFVLIDGPLALPVAAEVRGYLPEQEMVVAIGVDDAEATGAVEVSALLDSGALPVADRTMRGAAYVGGVPDEARLAELVRVTRPTGRVVVETAGTAGDLEAAAALLERAGAQVRARDASGLAAVVF